MFEVNKFLLRNFSSTFSRVLISFKEELFTPSRRLEYYNLNQFLANSGGLFGLFMGASLLSFIELLYYFTLRVFFTRRKQNQIQGVNNNTSLLQEQRNRKMELLNKSFAISTYYHNTSQFEWYFFCIECSKVCTKSVSSLLLIATLK